VLNFEIITALLARAAAGKVMMQLTREENFLTHRARPQTDIRLKLGMCRDGRIAACECEVTQRGGAYAGYGIVTILYAGALLQGIYDIPAIKYDGYRIYANLPPLRGASRESSASAHPHHERSDGEQLRAAGMSRCGRTSERLARAHRQAATRQGSGYGVLALRQRRR
jgi:4-hydroxybenzoyl-CoA reductase subunit alpha